jgi:hypothetical protein
MFGKGQDGYTESMTGRQLVEHQMDEVDAMTRAGESVGKAAGKAVGTGLRAARVGAVRAGHAGAEVAVQIANKAEHKLAERGLSADQIRELLAERADLLAGKAEEVQNSTRRTSKKLAKQRKRLAKTSEKAKAELLGKAEEVRKEVAKATKSARKDAKGRAKDARAAAKRARREFASTTPPRRRRRWPWLIALLAAAVSAGYVALTRRPQEIRLLEDEPPTTRNGVSDDVSDPVDGQHARNGQVADRQRH